MILSPEYSRSEHLGDPYLGAWYAPESFDSALASQVASEIYGSGKLEPVREVPPGVTEQNFERLIIDLTREHNFPKVEELGLILGKKLVSEAGEQFPALEDFQTDEAAVQIYPAGSELPLGWHKDDKEDKIAVISAIICGDGTIGFTEKKPKEQIAPEDIVVSIYTAARAALYFRANGLYVREDASDIRETHARTSVGAEEDCVTIQYRMEVNAAHYGNIPVNHDSALKIGRLPISQQL